MPTPPPSHSQTPRRRSLADELRSWTPDRLAALIASRPDLAVPPPASVAALAERASQRASVGLAMDRLDAFTLQVLQALAVSPEPVTAASTAGLLGLATSDPRVANAIEQLRSAALLWGPDSALRPLVNAREALGENPVGLGPPLVSALSSSSPASVQGILGQLGLAATADPVTAVARLGAMAEDAERMRSLLAEAPPGVEGVLEKLVWGPPFGRVHQDDSAEDQGSRAAVDQASDSPDSPIEWLLARGLLGRWGEDTVVLPREIAFFLRRHVFGTGLHRDLAPEAPAMPLVRHNARHADEAAAAAAVAVPRHVADILDLWAVAPPGLLRSGGISIRDLRRTALSLNVPEPETAFFIEAAYAAGLVAADLGSGFWLPTPGYDRWFDQSPERRWAELASAWLASDRCAGRVGLPDERNRPVAALSPEVAAWAVTELRRDALAELAELPRGATTALDSLVDRLFWQRPRRSGPASRQLIEWTLREAVWLGMVAPVRDGAGILTTQGRAITRNCPHEVAAAALSAALPEPLDHILIQGDLTAIAPGPLVPALARELALVADVESSGAATVYRFSAGSVRRAFDSGRAADDLHALLAKHSLHAVPQALTYLIDDVARRHGRIRVGATTAYVRADNDAALAEILADRRNLSLGLRRISPGVAVSSLSPEELLDALRTHGYAPMAEADTDGPPLPATKAATARRASSFHPYAPQRPVLPASDAIVALAGELLDAG